MIRVKGYASVFGEVDKSFDRISRGAFVKTLNSKKRIPMFYKHFRGLEIGSWERIEEDERGLYVEGDVCPEKCRRLGILEQIQNPLALSVGMTVKVRNNKSKIRDIDEAELREISILPRGQQICQSAIIF